MTSVLRHNRRSLAVLAAVCLMTIGGCDSDDVVPAATQVTAISSAPPPTTPPVASPSAVTTTTTATGPVEVAGVYENVEFYPACGNETLGHLGVTWYPLVHVGFDPIDPRLQDDIDEVLAVEREESPVTGRRGLVRVSPPGPGDDNGTLVVWADGVARWVSENGELDVWMIDDKVVYNWVC